MINFQYARAADVADAVRQMAGDPAAKFIAGGTNLIDLMKEDVERPTRLIDISRLPLKSVEETADGGLRIGKAGAVGLDNGIVGLADALPALVAVHRVIAANHGGHRHALGQSGL